MFMNGVNFSCIPRIHIDIPFSLNIFLSITAFLGNTLILVALHKESSLHPPSKLLCRCASASFNLTGIMLCSVSLSTLSAISVDRLLALLFGLRYRQVVTLERTYLVVVVFWIVSIVT